MTGGCDSFHSTYPPYLANTPNTALKLNYRQFGEGDEALVILPGLLGSSANWQSIAKRMGQSRTVYALDMRNHGQSPWADSMNYHVMAEDVAEFISGLPRTRVHLLGHSMGGKAAMRLAFEQPELLESLIVADIAPVSYTHDFDELIEPMLALNLPKLQSRSDADAELQRTVDNPGIRAFLLHNLHFDKALEQYTWRPNLKVLLDNIDEITGFDLQPWDRYAGPALFIYGGISDYVTSANREIIRQHFPAASFHALEKAGHWLHAEQPQAFIKSSEAFLSNTHLF